MKEVHNEHLKLLINTFSLHYKVEQVLQRFNLLSTAVDKGDQYLLCCPFHEDVDPSFRIMKKVGIWNCFSCGQSGTLLKLVYKLSTTSLSFYDFADNLLRKDKLLKNTVGFHTIYKTAQDFSTDTSFQKLKKFKPDYAIDLPITALVDYLKQHDNSYKTLKASLSMIQQDIPIREIKSFYEEFYKHIGNKEEIEEVSILKLITEIEGDEIS